MGDTLSAGIRRTGHYYNDLALLASLDDLWDRKDRHNPWVLS